MQDTGQQITRTPEGSIDYAHYQRVAHHLRARAAHRSLANLREAGRMLFTTALRMTLRSGAALWRAARAAVRFWNIPPLSPAYQAGQPTRLK